MKFSIPNKHTKLLSLGSNQGDRKENLTYGLQELSKHCVIKKQSGLYETPPLLPEQAPEEWNKTFLNIAVEISCDQPPEDFLATVKSIERKRGRRLKKRWAPRPLDIDLLVWDDIKLDTPDLKLPHPEMEKRSFVLDPLKDISQRYICKARSLPTHCPQLMGVVNITPDSFSDGGSFFSFKKFFQYFRFLTEHNVDIVDIGAESTRPGATPLSSQEEWERLSPVLIELSALKKETFFFPRLSLDTYHPENARRALSLGIDIINDVSGLNSPEMLSVLNDSEADYVLSHSLGIPADPKQIISDHPIDHLKKWFEQKWELLQKNSIEGQRIIFDPGIGFGKSALQSQETIRGMNQFRELPFRILVGHSRKSFFTTITPAPPEERDNETIGTSLALIDQGVDILRVHNVRDHRKALRGWLHARS